MLSRRAYTLIDDARTIYWRSNKNLFFSGSAEKQLVRSARINNNDRRDVCYQRYIIFLQTTQFQVSYTYFNCK